MAYEIEIRAVPSVPLAVARGQANARTIGDRIGELLPQVYAFLERASLSTEGRNVVLYQDRGEEGLFGSDDGVPIEVGVEVPAVFGSDGPVVCSATPGGRAAAVTHRGPYQQLPEAHAAVRRWCAENGHRIAGPNWEVYGDHRDNPDDLLTEVVYLLA